MHCELHYTTMSFDAITSGQLCPVHWMVFCFFFTIKAFQFSKPKSYVNNSIQYFIKMSTNRKIATGQNFAKSINVHCVF